MTSMIIHIARLVRAVALSAALASVGQSHAQDECEPQWIGGEFCYPGLDGVVVCAIAWDDGSGEALYVGGQISVAGCERAEGIAKWDGTQWTALVGATTGAITDGTVYKLAVFDDGTGPALIAAGSFEEIGGVVVNHIAKWDGTEWHPFVAPGGVGVEIGSSSFDGFTAMNALNDGSGEKLYVSGRIATAGGVPARNCVVWDGADWAQLPRISTSSSQFATITSFVLFDSGNGPQVHACGGFDDQLRYPFQSWSVSRLDGALWEPLETPGVTTFATGGASRLAVFDDGTAPALYAMGGFRESLDGTTLERIAKWDGSSWQPLAGPQGVGLFGNFLAGDLVTADIGQGSRLFAAGRFETAGGIPVESIAQWDGTSWSPVHGISGGAVTSPDDSIRALTALDLGTGPLLIATGAFQRMDGDVANFVAQWDTIAWSSLSQPDGIGPAGDVRALHTFNDGTGTKLYVAGSFDNVDGMVANSIASWNGNAWSLLDGPNGVGVSEPDPFGSVLDLTTYDDGEGEDLYVVGDFEFAGGERVEGIARWDGVNWSQLSTLGVNQGAPRAIEVFDDGGGADLYVGGTFDNINTGTTTPASFGSIGRWDGQMWSTVSGPSGLIIRRTINAMSVYDDGTGPGLYIGGDSRIGNAEFAGLARYDGTDWSPLDDGVRPGIGSGAVNALANFDGGGAALLYVGGSFGFIGGLSQPGLASWDGAGWAKVQDSNGFGIERRLSSGNPSVSQLFVIDDGGGPVLYVSGSFDHAGDQRVFGFAKWDGTTWSPVVNEDGTGLLHAPNALAVYDSNGARSLYAGASYQDSDSRYTKYLVRRDLCIESPPCTGDIADDFGTLGGDGQVSFGDFLALLGLVGPCPGNTPGCTGDIADDFGTLGGDGQVSFGDFLALLGVVGPCP